MKEYYNNDKVSEIDFQIKNGNPNLALLKAEEYILEYPNDSLGVIYRARALAATGSVQEAIDICEDYLCGNKFHTLEATVSAYYWYGVLLEGVNRYEDAIMIYKKSISYETKGLEKTCYKSKIGLAKALLRVGKNEEVIALWKENDDPKDILAMKAAHAYVCLGKYKEAFDIVNKINYFDRDKIEQQVNYIKGVYYYELKQYDTAEKYFQNSNTQKNRLGFKSYIFLSKIKLEKYDIRGALDLIKMVEDVPSVKSETSVVLFRIYMSYGNLDKCKEYLSYISHPYLKKYYSVFYYYSLGDYETTLSLLNSILTINNGKQIDTLFKIYINSHLRLGKYEEALYKLEWLKNDLGKSYYDLVKTYIYKKLGKEYITDNEFYSLRQVKDYSKKRAIDHIISHHTLDESLSSFHDERDVEKVYDYVKANLDKYEPLKGDIFDKYFVPYSSVGFDQNGYCDTLIVIANPDDLNIITMYPLYGGDSYMEEETKAPKKEVKRLSQIDKFNQRYGNK